ncbi:MAG: 30S ribosomal protein S6e [Promethearchaeota archaeon]|nr:MAG: 30S ribosomal protein S6e [Candidatus Lokiarchaeota archaeon]
MSEESLYKINISGGKTKEGKGLTKVVQLQKIDPLVGKVIGEIVNGGLVGLPGYELKITGGSDFAGIPMRPHVHGPVKKKLLLRKGPGYKPLKKGEKRRKVIRGSEITDDMKQINMVVIKAGKTKLFDKEEE